MASRHSLIYLLFFAVAAALAIPAPAPTHSAPPAVQDEIPEEAMEALRAGRFLRASLVLREYLATHADTTPSAILLAARAEAGWGDWQRVHQLLEGRSWLDRIGAGYGWHLLGRSQIELGRLREGSTSLGRYLAMAEPDGARREQGLAQLGLAEALAKQKQDAAALVAYDRAAELLPQVADWVRVFAARAAANTGDTAGVRVRLDQVDSALAAQWSWRTAVRARRNAGDLAGALQLAERAAATLDTDSRRAAAWTLVGSIREERQDHNGARAAYIRAMNLAAGSSSAVEAARQMSRLAGVTAGDQLLIGRVYLRHGNITRGIGGLQAYIDAERGTAAQRAELRYEIANALFRAGQYGEAEQALLEVARSAPARDVAADALYTAARAQYRDGRAGVARTTLLRIVREYADQPAAVRAAYLMADLDHDDGRLDRAEEHYREAIRFAPGSREAGIARMRLGGIAFSEERYEDALREFEEYRATHRTGAAHQQATFWSAQALARLGRTAEARRRFADAQRHDPFSYYGGLAADELDIDGWSGRLEPSPPSGNRYEPEVARALARVDLLREIGWHDAAGFEMERVRRHFSRFDGALYTLAESLNERGFTHAGIGIGREIHRREGAWNLRLLRIVNPFPFRAIIMAEAQERGVDPYLAAALIRQESMFNPQARSPVGALGLMQVMPQTGRSLATRLGISRFQPERLLQPELNVHFGTAYLADQLRAYGDRIDVVLAAYNAGPGRVSRWKQFPEYTDPLLFAERIPYTETRDYVRIVQNNRRLYAILYAPD